MESISAENDLSYAPDDDVSLASHIDPIAAASSAKDARELAESIELPLEYARQIQKEVLEQDLLVVLARGLGLHWIVASTIQFIDAAGTQRSNQFSQLALGRESLVIIVGASDKDNSRLSHHIENLRKSYPDIRARGLQTINSELDSNKRRSLYKGGGVYSVTSEILIVDMLNGVVEVPKITGLVILNAHGATDTNKIGFIVNLFRDKNKAGFIKAFTDRPESVSYQINGLSNKVKFLGVPKVSLWPRFHVLVSKSLPQRKITEIIIEISPNILKIQELLSTLLGLLISEIKRRIGTAVDTEGWNLDAALTSDLPRIMRFNLEKHWHRVGFETRQNINQISQLQELLRSLTDISPVAFYRLLNLKLKAEISDSMPPAWVLHEAANETVEIARARIDEEEDLPKWTHLLDILEANKDKSILIYCNDIKIANQLYYLLYHGEELAAVEKRAFYRDLASRSKHPNVFDKTERKEKPLEKSKSSNPSKRRRIRGGGTVGEGPNRADFENVRQGASGQGNAAHADPVTVEVKAELYDAGTESGYEKGTSVGEDPLNIELVGDEIISLLSQEDGDALLNYSRNVRIVTYGQPEVLESFAPDVIVMYELNLEFTRHVEAYMGITKRETELFLMYYQRSIEELQFLSEVRREKDSFTSLIREKGNMPMIINDVEERQVGMRVVSTRVGGRVEHQVYTEQPKVIVDAREFRSELPHLIWQQKMDVIPMTLLVGDYIITPTIAVERKSVADLSSSAKSGRLLAQIRQMFKFYKTVMLLIEFSDSAAFSFETFEELRAPKVRRDLGEALALLLINFPKLQIIWSASPRHSAEIFRMIKTGSPEPDPIQAVSAGRSYVTNYEAVEMLRVIPGVNARNLHLLLEKIDRLSDLADMSFEDLDKIVGPDSARQITSFLDKPFKV